MVATMQRLSEEKFQVWACFGPFFNLYLRTFFHTFLGFEI